MVPRLATKLMSKSPGALPGSSFMEQMAAKATHWGLYGFLTVMPATGIAMGYYGGKGTTRHPNAQLHAHIVS